MTEQKPEDNNVNNSDAIVTPPVVDANTQKPQETETPKTFEAASEEVAKWKFFSRQNEDNLKEALNREKDLKEKLTAAEAKANSVETEKTIYEIAYTKGLPAESVELLKGVPKEEVEAKADALVKLLGQKQNSFGFNPLQGGGGNDTKPLDNTPEGLLGSLFEAAKES